MEDEEPLARALERWLKRQGAQVRVVLDPGHVETALREFDPTHVVSDLHMPGVSGITVLEQALKFAPGAVRCLLSGSLETLTPERLIAVNPVLLISKPWDDAKLAVLLGFKRDSGA